jgi:hypothetical protein
VNSRPRNWRPLKRAARLSRSRSSPTVSNEDPDESSLTLGGLPNGHQRQTGSYSNTLHFESVGPDEDVLDESQLAGSSRLDGARPGVCSPSMPTNVSNSSISLGQDNGLESEQYCFSRDDNNIPDAAPSRHTTTSRSVNASFSVNQGLTKGSSDIQESCLMRYFMEELSPWVRHVVSPMCSLKLTLHSLIIVMSGVTFS